MARSTEHHDADIAEALIDALERVLPGERPIALHEPELGVAEREAVAACVDSGFVSSVGERVGEFERRVAEFTGAAHAVAVVNGTAALSTALVLAGVEPGDEVVIPALSFVGTANAVAHAGAVPRFADSEEGTLGLDPAALARHLDASTRSEGGRCVDAATGRRIAAIVPMHVFGHPVDMDPLIAVARDRGIPVVEDAAESLGSLCGDRHTGTIGELGILSFNGNKIATTGGGGAILTDDEALAVRARHLTTTAKLPHRWAYDHDAVAWNHRMPNLNAALGCAQMERLPSAITRKRALAAAYAEALAGSDELAFVHEPPGTTSNYWLCAVRVRGDASARDAALLAANDAGLHCRPAWRLLSSLPMFEDAPRAPLPVATMLEEQLVCLPSSARLADA